MVFNATFNNISAIWWRSIYIVKQFNDLQKKLHRKPKDRATWTSLKTESELGCSGWVGSSCSTSGTRRVTLVISHEWGKDLHILTTSGTYTWSFLTQTNFITWCCIVITDVSRIETKKKQGFISLWKIISYHIINIYKYINILIYRQH